MTNEHEWKMRTWARKHATHGAFFVGVDDDGMANAQRVHGSPDPRYQVEELTPPGRFANVALAMMACEARIAELDRAIVEQTCADLRAYSERVA